MVKQDYQRALAAARSDFEELTKERERIDGRLIETRDVILSLSKLCEGTTQELILPPADQYVADPRLQNLNIFGLTDAVRIVMQTHIGAVDAKRIRNRLLLFKFDLKKYSNPMAAIHGVIVRLMQAGDVKQEEVDGKPTYRWTGTIPVELASLLKADRINRAVNEIRKRK